MKLKVISCKDYYDFLKDHYDAPEYLIPSIKEMENPKLYLYCRENIYGKVVGVTSFLHLTPRVVETLRTVVAKGFREEGLGKSLAEDIEKIIRNKGYQKMTSHVYTDNHKMICLKIKQGFLVEGLSRNHDGDGCHEYRMSKELWCP